jgi:hypothetical protein
MMVVRDPVAVGGDSARAGDVDRHGVTVLVSPVGPNDRVGGIVVDDGARGADRGAVMVRR